MSNEELIVICAAKTHLGFQEAKGKPNWGSPIEEYLRKVGHTTPQPWCAAFVAWVGWHALHDPVGQKSSWPVPLTAGCKVMGDWAEREGVLTSTGAEGQVYLLYYPSLKRFAHTGFIVAPSDKPNEWFVIDGNSNNNGSREGYQVIFRKRVIDPARGHRFIDWRARLNVGGS